MKGGCFMIMSTLEPTQLLAAVCLITQATSVAEP